jgi:SAM-dependent methyltransferase
MEMELPTYQLPWRTNLRVPRRVSTRRLCVLGKRQPSTQPAPSLRLWLAFSILAALLAPSGNAQTMHQEHHPPQSAEEYARVLEDPARDEWQKPHEVMMALQLKSTDVVADIGAGTGYFARRFAMHAAKVFAIDIDPKLLEIAAKGAPPNLIALVSKPDDPLLAPASVDLIFFCDVLHHIQDRLAYYRRMTPALKIGGRVVVVDFYKRPLPIGPPPEMKLDDEALTAEFKQAGFLLLRKETFLPYQYFLEFGRAPDHRQR